MIEDEVEAEGEARGQRAADAEPNAGDQRWELGRARAAESGVGAGAVAELEDAAEEMKAEVDLAR